MSMKRSVWAVAAAMVFTGCYELEDGSFASFFDWLHGDDDGAIADGGVVSADSDWAIEDSAIVVADTFGVSDDTEGAIIADSEAVEADSGGVVGFDSDIEPTLCEQYCEMEANCIPVCAEDDGSLPCASPEVQDGCAADCEDWALGYYVDPDCAFGFMDWVKCVSALSCDDVAAFFHAHPDDVVDGTPCGDEFHAMNCNDFEPRTEYSFD